MVLLPEKPSKNLASNNVELMNQKRIFSTTRKFLVLDSKISEHPKYGPTSLCGKLYSIYLSSTQLKLSLDDLQKLEWVTIMNIFKKSIDFDQYRYNLAFIITSTDFIHRVCSHTYLSKFFLNKNATFLIVLLILLFL